jgi:hypothetical protein
MNLAGLGNGAKGFFANQAIEVQAGRAINQEGNLAGSTQFMDSMVRNLLNWQLASVEDCFEMGSSNPAKLLGLENSIGAIAAGYQADMVLWHRPTMQVLATWVAGQLLWCDPQLMGIAPPTPPSATHHQPVSRQQSTAFSTPSSFTSIIEEGQSTRNTTKLPAHAVPQGIEIPMEMPHSSSSSRKTVPKAFAPSQHIGLI